MDFVATEFIPHVLLREGRDAATGSALARNAGVRLTAVPVPVHRTTTCWSNLGAEAPAGFGGFERLIEIVSTDGPIVPRRVRAGSTTRARLPIEKHEVEA